jgi:hypothetical protein
LNEAAEPADDIAARGAEATALRAEERTIFIIIIRPTQRDNKYITRIELSMGIWWSEIFHFADVVSSHK